MADLYDCSDPDARSAGLDAAADAIARGQLVLLPTDTVYGVAADAFTPAAVTGLLAAKNRGRAMPVPVLIGEASTLGGLVTDLPDSAHRLAEAFWPGGLTLVVPQRDDVTLPPILTAGARTIGLRVPDHDAPRALAAAVGPIPTTSANRSGAPEAADAASIVDQLGHAVAVVLDGGPAHGGPPSTVVDCTTDPPRILRQGAIARADVERVLGGPVAPDEP